MIPLHIRDTIKESLWFWQGIAGSVDDSYSPTLRRIYAALAWLEALPVAPQPDWSQAPAWANWWAIDPNGYVCWYQEEPLLCQTITYCGWVAKTIQGIQQGNVIWGQELDLSLGIDWRTTLTQRPQEQP